MASVLHYGEFSIHYNLNFHTLHLVVGINTGYYCPWLFFLNCLCEWEDMCSSPPLISQPCLLRNCGHIREVPYIGCLWGEEVHAFIVAAPKIFGHILEGGLCWKGPLYRAKVFLEGSEELEISLDKIPRSRPFRSVTIKFNNRRNRVNMYMYCHEAFKIESGSKIGFSEYYWMHIPMLYIHDIRDKSLYVLSGIVLNIKPPPHPH